MKPEQTSDAIRATQARENVAALNTTALLALMREHNITIPTRSFAQWRPTVRNSGALPGFDREYTVLCTDGVVAWYIDATGALFYGHVQWFTGDIKPLHSVSAQQAAGTQEKAKKTSKAKSPKLTLELAMAALRAQAKRP